MNNQSRRKTIVAISMALVLGVGGGAFVLLHHSPAAAAPAALPVPDAIAQAPVIPAVVAPAPTETGIEPAKPSVASAARDTAAPEVAAPKVAGSRRVAKVGKAVDTVTGADDPVSSMAAAAARVAAVPAVVPAVDPLAMAPAPLPVVAPVIAPVADAQPATAVTPAAATTDAVAPDSSITAAVKSQLAADIASQGYEVGVTTTLGVVTLTGTLATQDAINHVRDVAASVKDVKSVDTSAMKAVSG